MSTIVSTPGAAEPEEREPAPEESSTAEDSRTSASHLEGRRRQAQTIIDTVMASGPEHDQARLAALIAEAPEEPEAVVARFLREVRPRISDYQP